MAHRLKAIRDLSALCLHILPQFTSQIAAVYQIKLEFTSVSVGVSPSVSLKSSIDHIYVEPQFQDETCHFNLQEVPGAVQIKSNYDTFGVKKR